MKNLFITAMCISMIALAGCNKASADNYTENAFNFSIIVKRKLLKGIS